MEEYFCMECKLFGYDVLGRGVCHEDETNPCMVSPYQVHTEIECFRMKDSNLPSDITPNGKTKNLLRLM